MAKKSPAELKAILAAEKADALAADTASTLSDERSRALDYYMGDVSADMPSLVGRSKVVSSDTADTIDGLMPSLMDIFAGTDMPVRFAPVGPEDIEAAEQETEYVNHVFWQLNEGFLVLYSMIKDALLSKLGIVKVFWEEVEEEQRETYDGLPEDSLALLVADPNVEIVEHTERAEGAETLHDVVIVKREKKGKARVVPVPPEEFGISRRARTIQDAHYCFHEVVRRQDELIADGYDAAQIRALPGYVANDSSEAQARDTVEESTQSGDDGYNKETRAIRVTEHYIIADCHGDGKPRLYRITTGGEGDGDILMRGGKPDIEPADFIPFAGMTPIIIPHRLFGRSVADLVRDIQQIKTALLRALMDNAYLANNPRVEVPESHASDQTLDDLLVSRPGGIVRTKQPGGLAVIKHPDIGAHVFPLMEYQDATREWRTGVTRQGQGLDADALQNQSATAANQLHNAAQAKMKLIARIFAETGIKDMFRLLHGTIRMHGQKQDTFRLRNKWVSVDPRNWRTRDDMTIDVGLGTGGPTEQLSNFMIVANVQKELLMGGKAHMVPDEKLFNSFREICKITKHRDPELFVARPDPNNPAPPPPDPKMMEMQAKAEIEKLQAQADVETQDRKTQAEIALAERKFELEKDLKLIDAQLKMREHEMQAQRSQAVHEQGMKANRLKMIGQSKPDDGMADKVSGSVSAVAKMQAQHSAAILKALQALRADQRRPKRAMKAPDGSWVAQAEGPEPEEQEIELAQYEPPPEPEPMPDDPVKAKMVTDLSQLGQYIAEMQKQQSDTTMQGLSALYQAIASMQADMRKPKRAIKNADGSWSAVTEH